MYDELGINYKVTHNSTQNGFDLMVYFNLINCLFHNTFFCKLFRRANIGFHHICGTKKDGANPCSLKLLREESDGTSKEDFVVDNSKLHNDGSLMNVTEWY